MVTEDELQSLLESQGWKLGRRKTGKQQAFEAKKYSKSQKRNITRYIAVTSTLGRLTDADVLKKLKE